MARFPPDNQRNAHVNDATFALDNSHVDDATFDLLEPPPLPQPQSAKDEERGVQEMLERAGIASAEAAFLGGERKYVISSNVSWIEYRWMNPDGSPLELLYVGYKDSSTYEYEGVSFDVARQFYSAASYGKFVWDTLRVRGTVFGFQYPYRLVAGSRVWHDAGPDAIARHEAVPKTGEVTKGYHPATNWRGVKGPMGAKGGGVNLGKKGGSKKVAHFIPAQVKFGSFPPTGPCK